MIEEKGLAVLKEKVDALVKQSMLNETILLSKYKQ